MAFDVVEEIITLFRNGRLFLENKEICDFLEYNDLSIGFTTDFEETVKFADYLFISAPTDYDIEKITLILLQLGQ